MVCNRFQIEGMKLLDGEMSGEEKRIYEAHVQSCEECSKELKDMGRIVQFTNELRLRKPDDEFWPNYWRGIYRRLERGAGFLLLIIGMTAVTLIAIHRAVTSPEFFTPTGIGITIALVGLAVVFLSVVRERYHEHKNDPYKGVEQ